MGMVENLKENGGILSRWQVEGEMKEALGSNISTSLISSLGPLSSVLMSQTPRVLGWDLLLPIGCVNMR